MGVPVLDLSQAPDQLRELVEEAARAGEVVLTRDGQAVARIVPVEQPPRRRQPGSARGLIHMAEEFDATPEDFRDYVEDLGVVSADPAFDSYPIERVW